MDHIYCDTTSARIDHLIPIWKQPSHGRLHAGKSVNYKNLCLTDAWIRLSRGVLNACLIPIWKQPSDGRLHMAASRYIEQPPHSRLQTAAWWVKKHLSSQPFPNGCLAVNSSRIYLAGGTILAM